MRLLRVPPGSTIRLIRGYAASAPKPEPEHDTEPQAESSTAAQRRLWPAPPVDKPKASSKPTRLNPETAVKRRRSPNALALMRAQKLAQAIIQESEPPSTSGVTVPPTPLSPSDSLRAMSQQPTQVAPTLEDLEAKRPPNGPISILSKRYPQRYKRLYETLDNAFVAKQLLKLAYEMGVKVPKGRGKAVAIKGILKVWGWEPPISKEEQEARERAQDVVMRDTVERDWELKQGELLLMMRDVESLRPIMEQGVRFSIPKSASATGVGEQASLVTREGWRILRGTGNEASLAEMDIFVNERREAIEQCTRDVYYVDQSNTGSILLGAISNAANVYIERKSGSKVRISGLNTESVTKAESLLSQATYHEATRTSTSRSLLVPSSSEEYTMALYPHLPSPTSFIPWQDLGAASRPLFRLRGVQPWEVKVGARETAHVEQNMEDLPFIPLGEEDQDRGVRTAIEGLVSKGSKSKNGSDGIVARFGHSLYAKAGSERDLLSPPITKRSTPTFVVADLGTVTSDHPSIFIPCLPPSLIHFPLDSETSRSRQLTYRASDGRVLEIVYPLVAEVKADEVEETFSEERGWYQELDDMLDKLEVDPVEEQDAAPSRQTTPPTPPQARILRQESKDIAMPDRPVDLNVTSRTLEKPLSDDENASIPPAVTEYLNNNNSAFLNLPPSTIDLSGESWNLVSALELYISEVNVEPSSDLSLGLDLGLKESNLGVKIRTVKSTDLTFGSGRSIQYAELESEGEVSSTFWTELARLSRVVAPGAGVLRTEIY